MNDPTAQLLKLYATCSKHSAYQVLTERLRALLPVNKLEVRSRSEEARWAFISRHIDFADLDVLEVGGNTGYFTFGALDAGARHVTYVEGNPEHAEFVRLARDVLGYQGKLDVVNRYYGFDREPDLAKRADVGIVLNVLHHLGDDFGDRTLGIERAKELMLDGLNALASRVDRLVFQMGFCWKGQRTMGLFSAGLKREIIDFVTNGSIGYWKIEAVGIPEMHQGVVTYAPPIEENLRRQDSLGEFLNRPLFVLRSTI